MQIAISKVSDLSHQMKITLPPEAIDNEVASELQSYTKKADIKGFRKGKVPLKVIKDRYGAAARHEVVRRLINEKFLEAVKQESVEPVGILSWDVDQDVEGKPLEFTVKYEVFPEIKEVAFKKVKIEKPEAEVSQKDIDDAVNRLRDHHGEWVDSAEAAKEGDKLSVTYEMKVGDEVAKSETSPVDHIIGKDDPAEEIKKALLGVKKDETVTAKVKASKKGENPAEYTYTIHRVQTKKLPELNDEFAKKLEVKEGTLESLMNEIKKNLNRTNEERTHSIVREAVLSALIDQNPLALPESAIENEAKYMAENMMRQYMPQFKGDMSTLNLPTDLFKDQAKRSVHLSILTRELIKDDSFKPTEEEVDAKVNALAQDYDNPEEYVTWIKGNEKMLDSIRHELIESKMIDDLLSKATVKTKKLSLEELLKYKSEEDE